MSESAWVKALRERQRRLKVTDRRLLGEAGVDKATWWRLRHGKSGGHMATREALEAAMERIEREAVAAAGDGGVAA